MMQYKENLIIQHNFTYRLPKSILDKRVDPIDKNLEFNSKNKYKEGGKGDGKSDGKHGQKHQIKSLKFIVIDPDPSQIIMEQPFFRTPQVSEGQLGWLIFFYSYFFYIAGSRQLVQGDKPE
jgi:hypothetical protein